MELALHDEEYGYYRQAAFGREGDFYTAAQLQPVFGSYIRQLADRELPGFTAFIDLGAGREDLRPVFAERYHAVHHGQEIPKTQNAILFANEFLDALPVEVESEGQLLRVAWTGSNFAWWPREPIPPVREHRPTLRAALKKAAAALSAPAILIAIDYGYTSREWQNFPLGSLLAYRQHIAHENVLADVGRQDLTAHVDWDSFFADALLCGWRQRSFTSMDRSLLSLGEAFATGMVSVDALQFKHLLFGLGPRFQVAILEYAADLT